MTYSLDTSSIIHAWREAYPPKSFPSLWKPLEGLIDKGQLVATEEVFKELERNDDEVFEWMKKREYMVIPIDELTQQNVRQILQQHRNLLNAKKNRSGADAFVIALAQVRRCTVVTDERPTGSRKRPHIPDVCSALGIRCVNFLQLIQEEGWII